MLSNKIFKFFDLDGNGRIDDYEFICACALFTKTSVEERIEAVFYIYDEDGTQICENHEFRSLVKTLLMLRTGEEVKQEKLDQKILELKSSYFVDKDYLTLAQFVDICKNDKDMLRSLKKIGMFGPTELTEKKPDCDLEDEIIKAQPVDSDEVLANRKRGVEQVEGAILGMFAQETVDKGDQFMAVKPAEGAIRNSVPSDYKPSNYQGDVPNAILKLQYVHGIRAHDTRNNLFYNPEGKLIYHTAELGIQLDTKRNQMKFVRENQDDIYSLDTCGNLTVTGDKGKTPVLSVWDNVTMTPVATVSGIFKKGGIVQVAFSRDMAYLAVTCCDPDSTITILDLKKLIAGEKQRKLFANFKTRW